MVVLTRSTASKTKELVETKTSAVQEVNALIGAAREKYNTPIPGQEYIYAAKEAEARAYLAASPAPTDLTGYPNLAAEVGITAPDAASLARLWVQMEHLRIGTKAAISVAQTTAEVQAALDGTEATSSSTMCRPSWRDSTPG